MFSALLAVTLTTNFNAVVDFISIEGTSFRPGDAITGTYSFNSEAEDLAPSPGAGIYISSGSPYGLSFTIRDTTFSSDNVILNVGDFGGGFQYVVGALNLRGPSPLDAPSELAVQFASFNGTTSPPVSVRYTPDVNDFAFREFQFLYGENPGETIAATPTSFKAVPEPSEILGTAAIAALGAMAYRKKRLTASDSFTKL